MESHKEELRSLSGSISFLVCNGWRVRFWKDKWYGDKPVCVTFPSLFTLTVSKEAWVADVWNSLVEGGG